MKFVKQKDEHGCAVACIAMVLGVTYEQVARDFENDFSKEGITLAQTMDYLGDKGFSIVYKDIRNWGVKDFARNEMLKPFAPVHILRVQPKFDSKSGHQVVMTKKGKLVCPYGDSDEQTRESYLITNVVGLFK